MKRPPTVLAVEHQERYRVIRLAASPASLPHSEDTDLGTRLPDARRLVIRVREGTHQAEAVVYREPAVDKTSSF